MSYGDWLISFFDLWFDENRPDRRIRYFDNMLRCLFRYPISTDNIGGRPVDVVVIETDGGIEPTDAFKSCENGLTKVGLNVLDHDFETVQDLEFIRTLQSRRCAISAQHAAPATLSTCAVAATCPIATSRDRGSPILPSIARDLEKLARHIRRRTIEALPADLAAVLRVNEAA